MFKRIIFSFRDDRSRRFYRLSYQELPTSSVEDGEIKENVYLTILDPDLNQIGEARVPQLTRRPGKHFAKDGEIWIYVNIMDEMGFIRLAILESTVDRPPSTAGPLSSLIRPMYHITQ